MMIMLSATFASACTSELDCELNGACIAGACVCDMAWAGPTCGDLELEPAPTIAYGYGTTPNTSSWGAGPPAFDTETGTFHLFASEIAGNCGMGTWSRMSQVVHAVAESAAGPYRRKGVLISTEAHNTYYAYSPPDRMHLLYTIFGGDNPPSCNPWFACSNGTTPGARGIQPPSGRWPKPTCPPAHSVHVHYSRSLDGPWHRAGPIRIDATGMPPNGGSSNPAPHIFPNGTVLLLGRGKDVEHVNGTKVVEHNIFLYSANHWNATYRWVPSDGEGGAISVGDGQRLTEDPTFWRGRRGFHILFHSHPNLSHAWSTDGLHWRWSAALIGPATQPGGDNERPRVLLDAEGDVALLLVGQLVDKASDAARTAAFRPRAQPYPRVANPPTWSWGSLGAMAFVHSGNAAGFNATDLLLLSKFSMVQFDKKQNTESMPGASQEDRFITAARQVRQARSGAGPPVQVLMYLNGLINFPAFQRLHNATVDDPSLLLRDSAGKLVQLVDNYGVFDMRQPKMRDTFVDAAMYGMASGAFNGVFIDRANWADKCTSGRGWDRATCESIAPAQRLLLAQLSATLGEGNITLSKETSNAPADDWQVANAAMTSDAFCSTYCHGCNQSVSPASRWETPRDAQDCAQEIATIANMSARGQLSQSHAMGPFDGKHAAAAREFTMAAFLVGAGNLSFFSYANWAESCWELPGTRWWPEYDRMLGHPTSPPNRRLPGKRWKYTRNFSSGTTVYVDLATRAAEIKWAE